MAECGRSVLKLADLALDLVLNRSRIGGCGSLEFLHRAQDGELALATRIAAARRCWRRGDGWCGGRRGGWCRGWCGGWRGGRCGGWRGRWRGGSQGERQGRRRFGGPTEGVLEAQPESVQVLALHQLEDRRLVLEQRAALRRVHRRVHLPAAQHVDAGVAAHREALRHLLGENGAILAEHLLEAGLVDLLPHLLALAAAHNEQLRRLGERDAANGEQVRCAGVDAAALLHECDRLVRREEHALELVGVLELDGREAAVRERELLACCLVGGDLLGITVDLLLALLAALLVTLLVGDRGQVDVRGRLEGHTIGLARQANLDVGLEQARLRRATKDARPARGVGDLGRLDLGCRDAAHDLCSLQPLRRYARRVEGR
mmetsp:Transcript_17004/g.57211  ORF Transcript_17004/g.57211 Transcript_17004/m.57211 type:complete len:374 (+) Transcript_17004:779-1900(+)